VKRSRMGPLTNGECHALAAAMLGIDPGQIMGFVVLAAVEAPDCPCGHPEEHREVQVATSIDDFLLVAAVLAQALGQGLTAAIREKHDEEPA
jgi:hypothetical protein